jgi:hypothetical protein
VTIQIFNEWLKAGALILGGCWAVYTFIAAEFHKVGHATIDHSLTKVGSVTASESQKVFSVVEAKIRISNMGTRRVSLCPAMLLVHARSLGVLENGEGWISVEKVVQDSKMVASRDFSLRPAEPIFFHAAFADTHIEPGEILVRSLNILVPDLKYNYVESRVGLEYSNWGLRDWLGMRWGSHGLRWKFIPKGDDFELLLEVFRKKDGKTVSSGKDAREQFGVISSSSRCSLVTLPKS